VKHNTKNLVLGTFDMRLPLTLEEKIKNLYYEIGKNKIVKTQTEMTEKYKNRSGRSVSLIDSNVDSSFYAISRMPATFSVIYDLANELLNQNLIKEVLSIADFGSGTGAGYFALSELFDGADISLFERDLNMIKTFELLTDKKVTVNQFDLLSKNENANENSNGNANQESQTFDLCLSSYVLSEMTEIDRNFAFKKLAQKTNKYLLLIDTGTPQTYTNFMKLKQNAENLGLKLVAPCMSNDCPLENDYCQFYSRVGRPAVLRQAKQAAMSYEDEKYFYLLFEKIDKESKGSFDEQNLNFGRVIRRPIYHENQVELSICTSGGVERKIYTKRQKDIFKLAKKVKINGLINK
jgi:ribosomal protein RSM22 (predicted rRNA methylase)